MPSDYTSFFSTDPDGSTELTGKPMYLSMDLSKYDIFILGYCTDKDGYRVSTGWWQYRGDVCVNEHGVIKPYVVGSNEWSDWCEFVYHTFDEVKENTGLFLDEDDGPDARECGWLSPDGEWQTVYYEGHAEVARLIFGRSEGVLERTFVKVVWSNNDRLVGLTSRNHITEYQKQVLLQKGIDTVYNGNDIVWSSNDEY